MATKKSKMGIGDTDRFTSGGIGIKAGNISAEHQKRIDAINKELAAQGKKKKK